MLGDPKECRKNAEDCLRLAAAASTPDAKERFEALAHRWLALAADEEASTDLLRQWGDEPQEDAAT